MKTFVIYAYLMGQKIVILIGFYLNLAGRFAWGSTTTLPHVFNVHCSSFFLRLIRFVSVSHIKNDLSKGRACVYFTLY